MLLAILSICIEEELTDTDADSLAGADEMPAEPAPLPKVLQWRWQEIKNKNIAVGQIQKVFRILSH
jgi:serine/threonine-protein phosphatase 2B catalytic subunit